ncbi:MAG: TadE/TadG family type IV pilus assembly protein [Pseudomonadota bacterium]
MGFGRRIDGNMAMLFALALVPIVGMVGFGIDSSRQLSAANHLQKAVDTAVLSTARTMVDTSLTEVQRKAAAIDMLTANYASKGDVTLGVPVVTFPETNAIHVEVAGTLPTTFSSVFGVSALNIEASAGARYTSASTVEAVLVLDTSASMQGTPLDDLKVAASAFAADLLDPTKPEIKVGIVPFSEYVNVGMGNRSATWIDVDADYTDSGTSCHTPGCTCQASSPTSWTNPETGETGTGSSCSSWSCPVGATPVCSTWTRDYAWYGCVGSRTPPWDVQDVRWDVDVEGLLDTNGNKCGAPLLPLTNVETNVSGAIAGLYAQHEWTMTYMPAGLSWGLRALSPAAPFTEAMSDTDFAANGGKKLMVLMSDGSNTASRSSNGEHDDSDISAANATTLAACTEVKNAGIELFVIAFNVTDADTITMLRECATTFTHYSAATNVAQLTNSFKAASASIADITLFD